MIGVGYLLSVAPLKHSQLFVNPLREAIRKGEPILSEAEVQALFSNIEVCCSLVGAHWSCTPILTDTDDHQNQFSAFGGPGGHHEGLERGILYRRCVRQNGVLQWVLG